MRSTRVNRRYAWREVQELARAIREARQSELLAEMQAEGPSEQSMQELTPTRVVEADPEDEQADSIQEEPYKTVTQRSRIIHEERLRDEKLQTKKHAHRFKHRSTSTGSTFNPEQFREAWRASKSARTMSEIERLKSSQSSRDDQPYDRQRSSDHEAWEQLRDFFLARHHQWQERKKKDGVDESDH